MAEQLMGNIFNIQRFSIHDGPGIRTTVFFKGCPLHCTWCHNPESRDADPVLSLLPDRCIECGSCRHVCPEGIAGPLTQEGWNAWSACQQCGQCASVCPSGARTMIGVPYSVDAILQELDKDRIFYDESSGGVTFSGGEPIMPPRNAAFLRDCLASCEARGYHRAVDTSGFVSERLLLEIAELTDLFLYDIKHMDETLHKRYVGVPNDLILENLRVLSRAGADVWIRLPLIPGINDDEKNIDATAEFIASLEAGYPVHLLPYHHVGAEKYRRLGQPYRLEGIDPPEPDHVENIAVRMRSYGLDIKIGG